MRTIFEICDTVRETSYAIHLYLGAGHLEKVYENALANRLRKLGFDIKQQCPVKVFDEDGTILGDYFTDIMVENVLLLELKTAKNLAEEHFAQIMAYLKSTRMEHGMLINFGSHKFEIKKFIVNDLAAAQERLRGPRT